MMSDNRVRLGDRCVYPYRLDQAPGITVRAHFALEIAKALVIGIKSAGMPVGDGKDAAILSVQWADALLNRLEE